MTAFKPLVFSGVQPTGNLHLGNYLGAIRRFAQLQASHDCIYCVVDLHAITVWQDPAELISATREVTAAFLAAGIDPKKHIVFNQSRVVQHAELAWIFNCVARMGWLNRMTQFKEKAGKDRENASVGLFAYPTLMAADILVYRATHVPVGDDQKQHLELTRDIAQKFNNDYSARIADLGVGVEMMVGEETVNGFFPITEPLIEGPAPRVMSLRDGSKKMSKSDPFRPVAHQPDRRRRHDLQEDPQGQDRSGRRCRRRSTGSRTGRRPKTSSCSMPRWPRPAARQVLARFRRPAVFGVQAGAGRSGGRKAGADRRRDAPHLGRSAPMSTRVCATAASAPACWPRRR